MLLCSISFCPLNFIFFLVHYVYDYRPLSSILQAAEALFIIAIFHSCISA